ncbi:hypothetical protein [Streptomyces parvulus]|uniref:hypothetical protein n=2 Tax=Streptomyces parvulus TaxID=146923 RepID=UPI00368A5AB4
MIMYFGVVDVRDVVDLHLGAMVHPKAAGERFPWAADLLPSVELTIEQVREAAKTAPALRTPQPCKAGSL